MRHGNAREAMLMGRVRSTPSERGTADITVFTNVHGKGKRKSKLGSVTLRVLEKITPNVAVPLSHVYIKEL